MTSSRRPLRTILARALAALLGFAVLALSAEPTAAVSRIEDITDVEGVRENMLIGYGSPCSCVSSPTRGPEA